MPNELASPLQPNLKFVIRHSEFQKCQGDHGRCRANYRCCLPALAGFVSPHSMGPGSRECAARRWALQVKSTELGGATIFPIPWGPAQQIQERKFPKDGKRFSTARCL